MFANKSKVYLFTRPRRFGKSLNMSMLKQFFNICSNKSLFDGLKISKNNEICEKYKNKKTVISITLKSVQGGNYIIARNMFSCVMEVEVRKFSFLKDSDKLDEEDKKLFRQLLYLSDIDEFNIYPTEKEALEKINAKIGRSLQVLTSLLYKHYGIKPIVLIDEYDVPLAQAFYDNYYDEMIKLIRSFFDNGLKTNETVEFAVLTGCLRISRESIFTGMNNLNVYTVSCNEFSTSFGFPIDEVKEMLEYYEEKVVLKMQKNGMMASV